MSSVSVEFDDLFAGDPDRLDPRAAALVTAAEAIARATDAMRGLIEGQTSKSTEALRETASDVARSLSHARGRYRDTGQALQTYAADLRPIQRDARTAVSTAEYYEQKSYTLPNEISRREGDQLRAEAMEAPQWQLDEIEHDLRQLRRAQSDAYTQVEDSRRALYDARDRLRAITDAAIAKIDTAIEDEKDSFSDQWNKWWDDAAGWMGEWFSSVLKGILEFLGELLAVLVAIVVIVLVLVIIAIALIAIAAVIGWVALAALAVIVVAAMLITFLVRDGLGSPRGPINENWDEPRIKRPSDADDADSAEDYTSEDYGDLFQEIGRQDARGGEVSTVIRVVAITDEAGDVIGYRVQLPSTQNWSPFNDDGALNDLSADAMVALFPGVETQYEKAVWDAMERAGVFENDAPVMLTGWSLGGMMAGDVATDPRLAGRVQAVVTAGSAVDKYASDMDPAVRVTQVDNVWDPVHHLELVGYDSDEDQPGSNWQTYTPVDPRVHDSTMYGELADDVVPHVRPGDEVFFADDVEGTYEQVYEMGYKRG